MQIIAKGNASYWVASESIKGLFYEVSLKFGIEGVCTCKSFLKSQIVCKHILKVKERLRDKCIGIENIK